MDSDCHACEQLACVQRNCARAGLGTAWARLSGRPLPSDNVLTTMRSTARPLNTGPPDSPFLVFIWSTIASDSQSRCNSRPDRNSSIRARRSARCRPRIAACRARRWLAFTHAGTGGRLDRLPSKRLSFDEGHVVWPAGSPPPCRHRDGRRPPAPSRVAIPDCDWPGGDHMPSLSTTKPLPDVTAKAGSS